MLGHEVSSMDLRNSYNRIYASNPLKEVDRYYRWIVELLHPVPGRRLLDVACGGGCLLQKAEEKQMVAYGIDISDVAVAIARTNASKSVVVLGDAENLPWPNDFFDYVTNLGSLEHFLHPEIGVREMSRVLSAGGTACVMLPNSYCIFAIWRVLRTGYGPSHQQEFEGFAALNDWRDLLDKNGLRVSRIVKYNGFQWNPKRIILRPFVPLRLSYCFVFLCRKNK